MKFLRNLLFKRKVNEPVRTELASLLEQILMFLEKSDDSVWSEMEVAEVKSLLSRQLKQLEETGKINLSKLNYLFLPTAPLQEISLENGWVDDYMKLAAKYDGLVESYN